MGKTVEKKSVLSRGKILFIEDEEKLIDIYGDYFKVNNYDFIFTKDIKEALKMAETEKPDLVLLDLIIPKEEGGTINLVAEQGYDYLLSAQNNSKIKNIPIVVFTNIDTDRDRKKSQSMGAAAYILKRDCSPREVLETVEQVIDRSQNKN